MNDCKWNIINYILFTGNVGMLDWLVDNYPVSIIDALKDGGDTTQLWQINECQLSSFGLYACLIKRKNKLGLFHLAEKYPSAIEIRDWKSIIKIILI